MNFEFQIMASAYSTGLDACVVCSGRRVWDACRTRDYRSAYHASDSTIATYAVYASRAKRNE